MSNSEMIRRRLADWTRERNECDDALVHLTDSRHAFRMGLSVLSKLTMLRHDLERLGGRLITGRELVAHLAPIIHLARGNAQQTLRRLAQDDSIEVPGICTSGPSMQDEDEDDLAAEDAAAESDQPTQTQLR